MVKIASVEQETPDMSKIWIRTAIDVKYTWRFSLHSSEFEKSFR